jgi:hypothetical protein
VGDSSWSDRSKPSTGWDRIDTLLNYRWSEIDETWTETDPRTWNDYSETAWSERTEPTTAWGDRTEPVTGWNDRTPLFTSWSAKGLGFLLLEDGGYILQEDGGKIVLNQSVLSVPTSWSGRTIPTSTWDKIDTIFNYRWSELDETWTETDPRTWDDYAETSWTARTKP